MIFKVNLDQTQVLEEITKRTRYSTFGYDGLRSLLFARAKTIKRELIVWYIL